MRGMPRVYWLWFWAGFLVFMGSAFVSWSVFSVSGTASGVVGLVSWGVWLLLVAVGVLKSASHIGPGVISFWWSLAAFGSILLRVITGLLLTQETRDWFTLAGSVMVGIWILGGAVVFALWVIRRVAGKRTRESSKAPQ